jgi:iduronate 2-sulfatase
MFAMLAVCAPSAAAQAPVDKQGFNVLFIAVDDLRPQLGCYGDPVVHSPHIDRLAQSGMVFERAYCSMALCIPSRAAMLTGLRPDTTGVYDGQSDIRTRRPDLVTLPQYFKAHGYHTQGLGKVFHGGRNDEASWSVPHWEPEPLGYGPETRAAAEQRRREKHRGKVGPAYEAPDVPDQVLSDGQTASRAIAALAELKDRPFFLAVGFLRPHLPYAAPKRYWDLYDRTRLPLASNPFPPKDAPRYAVGGQNLPADEWGGQNEPRDYVGMLKDGPVSDEEARALIHGYLASISYMDAQVGRVLAELDRLGLREKTIVILWGDHGWHNGEHGMWSKHSNYEISTRLPLIVAVPGQQPAGRTTRALVEAVDIYPTLAALCDLPAPVGLEGQSFAPLLLDPNRPWKTAIFHQYLRRVPGQPPRMGCAIRTDRYRLVEWRSQVENGAQQRQQQQGTDAVEHELYDHEVDPNENVNVAKQARYAAQMQELTQMLHADWRNAQAPLPGVQKQ